MTRQSKGAGWTVAAAAIAIFAAVTWHGMRDFGPTKGYDGVAFVAFAETIEQTGRLPRAGDTYEWANPPAYYLGAVYLQQFARWAAADRGKRATARPGLPGAILWIVLVTAGVAAVACRPRRSLRVGGLVLGALAAVWAIAAVLSFSAEEAWRSGQVIALFWACVLLIAAGLLAREAWPGSQAMIAVTVVVTAVIPSVIRMAVMFHPETQFAALAVVSIWLVTRGWSKGWSPELGVALGVVLGLAALTRQTAAVLAVGTILAALVIGGRRAGKFTGLALVSLGVVVGPWWVYQTIRTGNPLLSYLDRPGYMLDHQPLSFFVSFPIRDLIFHPYREAFSNQLLPRFHADIWSDWTGGIHGFWADPSLPMRLDASTQSGLGLLFDALSIAGLAFFGGRGISRARAHTEGAEDAVLATAVIVSVITWLAFVTTLVRFPQIDGDPIKSTYVLFLAPLFALGAVAAGRSLWARGPVWRVMLCAWAALYGVSFAVHVATAF